MEKSDEEKRKKACQEYLEKARKERPGVNFILDITAKKPTGCTGIDKQGKTGTTTKNIRKTDII